MSCNVQQRKQVKRAARALRECAPTAGVDVLEPGESQYGRWTLDAALRCEGVPPAVQRELALAGMTLRQHPSQGDTEIVVATA